MEPGSGGEFSPERGPFIRSVSVSYCRGENERARDVILRLLRVNNLETRLTQMVLNACYILDLLCQHSAESEIFRSASTIRGYPVCLHGLFQVATQRTRDQASRTNWCPT